MAMQRTRWLHVSLSIVVFIPLVLALDVLNNILTIRVKVRALAANTAFVDAFKLSEVFKRARDMQASGEALKDLVSAFNVDMIARGRSASKLSNSVLEAYGEEAKFITFGREAGPMPPKAVVLSDVSVVG